MGVPDDDGKPKNIEMSSKSKGAFNNSDNGVRVSRSQTITVGLNERSLRNLLIITSRGRRINR